MISLTDVNGYDKEDDMEADISKNFSFCNVVLKTAVVIAEVIFDHYVNNCFFPQILERKITIMENDAGQNQNKNTVITLIRGVGVVTCIEFWEIFLVQRDIQ